MNLSASRQRTSGVAIALAVGAALAFAGSADAQTINAATTAQLVAAVNTTNATVGVPDTIQLTSGASYSPSTTLEITDDLTIRGTPTAVNNPTVLNGAAVATPTNELVHVDEGGSLTLEAIQMQTGGNGSNNFANIEVQGDLTVRNSTISGSSGNAIESDPGATAPTVTILNSTLEANSHAALLMGSTTATNINYSTITNNGGGGVFVSGGPTTIQNSIILLNVGAECGDTGGDPSVDHVNAVIDHNTDTTTAGGDCAALDPTGVGNVTLTTSTAATDKLGPWTVNGGPVRTRALLAGSPAIDSSNGVGCPQVDERFFVRNQGVCDRGAYELNAAADTTPPTCVVTSTLAGPPKTQTVTASDAGIGLQSIGNVVIDNGSVASPVFGLEDPSAAVTATKTNQAQLTHWSFDATDVAGNVKHCS